MKNPCPTIILRHRKENLKKCSLQPLIDDSNMIFFTYPKNHLPKKENYILLSLNGKELSKDDHDKGLFLIDGTWNLAKKMSSTIKFNPIERSLPKHYRTAYPRYQTGCPNPTTGLSSIEALYIAYKIQGRKADHLLKDYHFKDKFLKINHFTP